MNTRETATVLDILATLGARSFPSWDDLCAEIVQTAVYCLHGSHAFLAKYEPGADWMTLQTNDPSLRFRNSRLLPTLEKLHPFPDFLWITQDTTDERLRIWLADGFPLAASFLGVPVLGPNNTSYGVLGVLFPKAAPYQAADVTLLQLLAQSITRAVEQQAESNARQYIHNSLELATVYHQTLQIENHHLLQVKGDLRFLVNHEFRNALAVVQGFSEVLRDEPCTPEEVHDYAVDIVLAASRLDRIMQELLKLDTMPIPSVEHALDLMDHQDIREHVLTRVRSRQLPRALPVE